MTVLSNLYLVVNEDAASLVDTDAALDMFILSCFTAGPDLCAFYASDPVDIVQTLQDLYESLKRQPIRVPPSMESPDYGIVDYGLLKEVIFSGLLSPFLLWPDLARALAALKEGDGRPVLKLRRFPGSKTSPGHFDKLCKPRDESGYIPEAAYAISCNDGLGHLPKTFGDVEKRFEELANVSSFGSMFIGGYAACG